MLLLLRLYAGDLAGDVLLGPAEQLGPLAEALGPELCALERAPAPLRLSAATLREIDRSACG